LSISIVTGREKLSVRREREDIFMRREEKTLRKEEI
jgi:hypothetical protein